MNQKVVKINNLKLENIQLTKPKTNKFGGKAVYINYNNTTLNLQLPKNKIPFGISGYDSSNPKNHIPSKSSNDSVELSLDDDDVVDKLQSIDKLIIQEAKNNCKEYFGKQLTDSVIEAMFKPSIKYNFDSDDDIDYTYPPRLRLKMYKDSDDIYVGKFFDDQKESINVNTSNYLQTIPKGSEMITILNPKVWIVGNGFGVTYKPIQAQVFKATNGLTGYSINE